MKQKNRHNLYKRIDCIKRFCNDLKELTTKIINYEQKEMILLKDKEDTLYGKSKSMAYMQRKILLR